MPTPTVLDFITSAAILTGAYFPGQGLSPEDASMGLTVGNDLLEEWNLDATMVPSILDNSYNLSTGVGDYTIGPGAPAPFNVARPVRIERANFIVGSLKLPVNVVTFERWAQIIETSNQAVYSDTLWCDYASPLAGLHLNPVPTNAMGQSKLELFTWSQLAALGALADPLVFPLGYSSLFRNALALKMAPYLHVPEGNLTLTLQMAAGAKQGIQQLNMANLRGLAMAPAPAPQQGG